MSFLRLKRSRILVLMVVFSMLFSCGIALGKGVNVTCTPGEGTEIDVPQVIPSDPESPGDNQTDPEMTDNPEGDLNEETEGSGSPEGTGAPE